MLAIFILLNYASQNHTINIDNCQQI